MTGRIYRPDEKHPDKYQKDLNPDALAGQNYGQPGEHLQKNNPRTAHEIKDLHRLLPEFGDDELKQIPVMPPGSRLEEGAVYIDLKDPDHKEFKAYGEMEAGPDNWFVPKKEVDYQLWNRMIGVTNPERTGEGNVR